MHHERKGNFWVHNMVNVCLVIYGTFLCWVFINDIGLVETINPYKTFIQKLNDNGSYLVVIIILGQNGLMHAKD